MTQPWPSEAYGLYLKWLLASTPAIKHRFGSWIQPSHRRQGVTRRLADSEWLSPAMAAPGSCLPGAPIVWDTRPFMGETQGVAPGLWQGSAACSYNEDSDAIVESASRRLR